MMSKYILLDFNDNVNNYLPMNRYITTVYLSFTNDIPSEAEHLFDLLDQWPAYCGNANNGKLKFTVIYKHLVYFVTF